MTSRLLLEAGVGATISQWNMYCNPGVTQRLVSITDSGSGQSTDRRSSYLGHPNCRNRYTQRASLSYVTGSHKFKTGFQNERPITGLTTSANVNVNYTFRNGVPIVSRSARRRIWPSRGRRADMGIYAQDQWSSTSG